MEENNQTNNDSSSDKELESVVQERNSDQQKKHGEDTTEQLTNGSRTQARAKVGLSEDHLPTARTISFGSTTRKLSFNVQASPPVDEHNKSKVHWLDGTDSDVEDELEEWDYYIMLWNEHYDY